MTGTEILIKIDILYFLGIIGTLLTLSWLASKEVGSFKTSVKWIKRELNKIWDIVKDNQDSIGKLSGRISGLEGTTSPLNPTEFGANHIKKSGLQKIIDETNKKELLEKLEKSLPQSYTEYDVQENARQVMLSFRDKEVIRGVKDYVFKNGLNANLLLSTSGLLLRDNFLGRKHQIAKNVKGR